jgi:hypothetical protein
MSFGDNDFFELLPLPAYLADEDKSRLAAALKQFTQAGQNVIQYNDFYKQYGHAYFMQSDLVREVRSPFWNDDEEIYEKVYPDAIILSNTCDISKENKRDISDKDCLMAPIMEMSEFIKDLKEKSKDYNRTNSIISSIKAQLVTNLFYLPEIKGKDYVVYLDRVFTFPTKELNDTYLNSIEDNRIASLSLFGHYLFVLKLSYHLCRLPEVCDREILM